MLLHYIQKQSETNSGDDSKFNQNSLLNHGEDSEHYATYSSYLLESDDIIDKDECGIYVELIESSSTFLK